MFDREISELYQNQMFVDFCNHRGGEYREDLRNEIIVIILEMPQEKLKHIIDNGYLLPYAIQIIKQQTSTHAQSIGTRFNKIKQARIVKDTCNVYELEKQETPYDEIKDRIETMVLEKIHSDTIPQETFYKSRLILELINKKSVFQIAKKVGIPYRSVLETVNNYKQELIQWSESRI